MKPSHHLERPGTRLPGSAALAAVLTLGWALFSPAQATEGGLGRPITGVQGASFSGLIPPTPGWNMQLSYLRYSGRISASTTVPVGGQATLGLDATFHMFSVTGIYVWNAGQGRWNFASMATAPFIDIDARASLAIGDLVVSQADAKSGMYDAFFAPVIAGYHVDELRHLSLALYVYAPTGDYEPGRLANPSLNNWTFSPTVGYTQLFSAGSIEWSTTAAVDIYTRNDATDYQNGAVFRLDSLAIKRFANGWGVGGAGGWIQQIEDDDSALTPGGFRGRSLAAGPIVTYLKKWDGGQVEFSGRWLKEFNVENRLEGEPLMLSASIQF